MLECLPPVITICASAQSRLEKETLVCVLWTIERSSNLWVHHPSTTMTEIVLLLSDETARHLWAGKLVVKMVSTGKWKCKFRTLHHLQVQWAILKSWQSTEVADSLGVPSPTMAVRDTAPITAGAGCSRPMFGALTKERFQMIRKYQKFHRSMFLTTKLYTYSSPNISTEKPSRFLCSLSEKRRGVSTPLEPNNGGKGCYWRETHQWEKCQNLRSEFLFMFLEEG